MECRDTAAEGATPDANTHGIDGDVPAARVAALQHQRPRWDKSTGHEQGDQEAVLLRSITSTSRAPCDSGAVLGPVLLALCIVSAGYVAALLWGAP